MLATEYSTDAKVKKKLATVLLSWHAQFKDDPSMQFLANLHKTCGISLPGQRAQKRSSTTYGSDFAGYGTEYEAEEQQRKLDRERREKELEERAHEREREKEREREEKRKREEEKLKAKQEKALGKAKRKQEEEAKRNGVKRKPFNFEEVRRETALLGVYADHHRCRRSR